MWRPPRKAYASEAEKRRNAIYDAQRAAKELMDHPDVLSFWQNQDTAGLLSLCRDKSFEVGEPAYVTPTMIFTELNALLKSNNL